MEWIKCSDRMPEKDIAVLIWNDSDEASIGYLDDWIEEWRINGITNKSEMVEKTDFRWRCDEYMTIHDVTHWMPLPKQPEDNDDEDPWDEEVFDHTHCNHEEYGCDQ